MSEAQSTGAKVLGQGHPWCICGPVRRPEGQREAGVETGGLRVPGRSGYGQGWYRADVDSIAGSP